jgi:hypothetical protein
LHFIFFASRREKETSLPTRHFRMPMSADSNADLPVRLDRKNGAAVVFGLTLPPARLTQGLRAGDKRRAIKPLMHP